VIENAWKNRVIAAPLPSDDGRQLGSCDRIFCFDCGDKELAQNLVVASGLENQG
jgi:hypothetical protein